MTFDFASFSVICSVRYVLSIAEVVVIVNQYISVIFIAIPIS